MLCRPAIGKAAFRRRQCLQVMIQNDQSLQLGRRAEGGSSQAERPNGHCRYHSRPVAYRYCEAKSARFGTSWCRPKPLSLFAPDNTRRTLRRVPFESVPYPVLRASSKSPSQPAFFRMMSEWSRSTNMAPHPATRSLSCQVAVAPRPLGHCACQCCDTSESLSATLAPPIRACCQTLLCPRPRPPAPPDGGTGDLLMSGGYARAWAGDAPCPEGVSASTACQAGTPLFLRRVYPLAG